MALKQRPGCYLYFDQIRPALEMLNDSQLGQLLRCLVDYAENRAPTMPNDPSVNVVFSMMRGTIDRDAEKYAQKQLRGIYTRYCDREKKSGNLTPLDYDEWYTSVYLREHSSTHVTIPSHHNPSTSPITSQTQPQNQRQLERDARGNTVESRARQAEEDFERKRANVLRSLENYGDEVI